MVEKDFDKLFQGFNNLNVMVIGDVMIDSYMWGHVDRISPEAPVPIVAIDKKENRLGGAGNVALNIQALGANPIIYAVIGKDNYGKVFQELLSQQSLSDKGIVYSDSRPTTIKTRILSGSNQILRVDEEIITPINNNEESNLLKCITKDIDKGNIDVIIFEDYDKGLITNNLIEEVIQMANKKGIPTTVDPKKKNFLAYHGASLFKPNLKEVQEGMKASIAPEKTDDLEELIAKLKADLNLKMVLLTLSELGVFISHGNGHEIIPAHIRDIADVSGAGDTVISVAALCLAMEMEPKIIAGLSNLAGGIVCEKVGVVPIDKNQLMNEAKALLTKVN